jgi:nitrogen regulatory protein PII
MDVPDGGLMKLVTATVPVHVLDDLRETLLSIGIKGMMISPARGQPPGDMDAAFDRFRFSVFQDERLIVIETVVSTAIVDDVVHAISAACNETTSISVPILVSDVMLGVRIRNAELVTEG